MTFVTSAFKRKTIIAKVKDVVTSQIHELLVAKCDFLNKNKNQKNKKEQEEEDKGTLRARYTVTEDACRFHKTESC